MVVVVPNVHAHWSAYSCRVEELHQAFNSRSVVAWASSWALAPKRIVGNGAFAH